MSKESDKHERLVAEAINAVPGTIAERPKVGTGYPDVQITKFKNKITDVWVEVKMNHTDNLSNPRMFYKSGRWQTTYTTPVAKEAVKILNESASTKAFLKSIAKFSGIPLSKIVIPTTKSMLREPNAVPLDVMLKYFNQPGVNRYIASKENCDLGRVVIGHYTKGKDSPAYYMQAADDFYMISRQNPLNLDAKIPVISGRGDFKIRIGTRSDYYEVQAEIKIKKMPDSPYSVLPGSSKKNPFTGR